MINKQAERLGALFGDLVRAYQFRDKNQICCHDVTVSQCYALDALTRFGPMTMGDLAAHLYLDVSTVTRVVDQLLELGYVERVTDEADRRVVRANLTASGKRSISTIHKRLNDDYRAVLETIAPESREAVIDAIGKLLHAFTSRGCCMERRKGMTA